MEQSAEFFNAYVERLGNEVGNLTKLKIINETQIEFLEKAIVERNIEIENLKRELEKQNKKKKTADVNTSE